MVTDAQLSISKFVDIAVNAVSSESADTILSSILNCAGGGLDYASKEWRNNILKPKLFDATLKLLTQTEASNTNRLVLLKSNLIGFADEGENVDNLRHLLDWFHGHHEQLKKIELSLDNKWTIVEKLQKYKKLDHKKKQELFNQMAEIDKSDTLTVEAKIIQGINSNPEELKKLWDMFLDPNATESYRMMGYYMTGFNNNSHEEEAEKYHNQFFEKISEVFKSRSREHAKTFYVNLFPRGENKKAYLEKVQEIIPKISQEEVWMLKMLKNSEDGLRRVIKGRECFEKEVGKNQNL